ncbi:hypothetical protein MKEN_00020600 [Mycena kentingensis (nom. inval.)]|nr:hypothetical protein MKEN_00020600 [Mycena kentingensis (nom. inval.)]
MPPAVLHPLLRPERVERLPIQARLAAKRALKPTRSHQDVMNATQKCRLGDVSDHVYFLPVIYDVLGVGPPESAEQVAASTDAAGDAYKDVEVRLCGFFMLLGIFASSTRRKDLRNSDLLGAISARAWPWAKFLFTYSDYHPVVAGLFQGGTKFQTFGELLSFTAVYAETKTTHELVLSAPGFSKVVGAAAAEISCTNARLPSATRALGRLAEHVLAHLPRMLEPRSFNDFIEGVGGTLDHFGTMISAQVEILAKVDSAQPFDLSQYLNFIHKVDGTTDPTVVCAPGPASRAAARAGIIEHVIATANLLLNWWTQPAELQNPNHEPETISEELVVAYRFLLGHFVFAPVEYRTYDKAFGGRLFRGLALALMHLPGEDVRRLALDVVRTIMPVVLLDYRAVRHASLAKELAAYKTLVAKKELTRKPNEDWEFFLCMVQERLRLSAAQSMKEAARVCDNLKCHKTAGKQCSRCKDASYCSITCQVADWKEGKHREICDEGCSLGFGRSLGFHQRRFLRSILDHDYQTHKESIRAQQARNLAENPSSICLTVFDYSALDLKVHVSVEPLDLERMRAGEVWDEWTIAAWRRAEERARLGKHELHVIQLPRQFLTLRGRRVLLPLRTYSDGAKGELELHQ